MDTKEIEFEKLRHAYITVKLFLEQEGHKKVSSLDSAVEADLGMCGDDNYELFQKFVAKFELDYKNFDYSKHFHSEAELFDAGRLVVNLLTLSVWLPLKTIELLTFNKVEIDKPKFPVTPDRKVADLTFKDLLTWYIEKEFKTSSERKYAIKKSSADKYTICATVLPSNNSTTRRPPGCEYALKSTSKIDTNQCKVATQPIVCNIPTYRKIRTLIHIVGIIFLPIATSSCKSHLHLGTYEFKSTNAEWWRITLKADSTFFLEDYTAQRFDSSKSIGTMSGTWQLRGARLLLKEPYDPENDSVYDYKAFFFNRWNYRNGKIYAKGPEFHKLHFTLIK